MLVFISVKIINSECVCVLVGKSVKIKNSNCVCVLVCIT